MNTKTGSFQISRMFPHLLVVALAVCLACVRCGATSLVGTVTNPDGSGFNGYLYMSLAQQGALVSTGGCGGPTVIVPTVQTQIKIVNGALIGSPVVYGNDCMLPNGIYYNVSMLDNNGNTVMNDRWVIQGSSINVGTIVSVTISGTTQTLGGVTVIQGTPAGTQTVTQPSSTALNVNLFGVTNTATMPDGSVCNTTNCTFQNTVGFVRGINTGTSQPSLIWVGPTGNFWNRTYTGNPSTCTGVADGWTGVRTDTKKAQFCIGGHLYEVPMTLVF